MGKKKISGKKKSTARAAKPKPRRPDGTITHRMVTHKPNGAMSESVEVAPEETKVPIGEAMRQAVEQLGEVIIDRELAPKQMRELSDLYEDVTRRKAAYAAKADDAKIAKKSLESATDLLLEKVRLFTHPVALPLFDKAEAEEDRDDIHAARLRIPTQIHLDALTKGVKDLRDELRAVVVDPTSENPWEGWKR